MLATFDLRSWGPSWHNPRPHLYMKEWLKLSFLLWANDKYRGYNIGQFGCTCSAHKVVLWPSNVKVPLLMYSERAKGHMVPVNWHYWICYPEPFAGMIISHPSLCPHALPYIYYPLSLCHPCPSLSQYSLLMSPHFSSLKLTSISNFLVCHI